MQNRFFTDEQLVAYLDGEGDLIQEEEISAALKTDDALAIRVDALRIDKIAIQKSFAGLLPKDDVLPALSRPQAFGVWHLACVASAALVIGFGAGSWLVRPRALEWTDYVASYQSLYSIRTLAQVEASKLEQQAQLDQVASSIGKTVTVDMLNNTPEAEYKRAQILGYEGRPLIQLTFVAPSGAPIALCIIRSDNSEERPMQADRLEGLSATTWSKVGYEYLLIGGQDPSVISRLATQMISNGV